MLFTWMEASRESVDTLDAVYKSMLYQKIQRSVDNRWLATEAVRAELLEQFISPHRPMTLKQNLKDPSPNRCEAQVFRTAYPLDTFKNFVGTGVMVMMLEKGQGRYDPEYVLLYHYTHLSRIADDCKRCVRSGIAFLCGRNGLKNIRQN